MAVTQSLVQFVFLSVATAQLMHLFEGDVCKEVNGTLWTCQKIMECPKAQFDLRMEKRPRICSFMGASLEPIVCCEPSQPTPSNNNGQKSTQMCEKYSKLVYIEMQIPNATPMVVDTCAAVEPLVVLGNGKVTDPREYPHMALIGYGNESSIEWLCGGSLISERYVLSAAHCTHSELKGSADWVRLGDYNIHSKQDDIDGAAKTVQIKVAERIDHPEYKRPIVYNDIALYKLETDVVFNEYIRPICLQTEHQFPGTYGIATGWGQTVWRGLASDVLQKVNLTIIPRAECADAYQLAGGLRLNDGIRDKSMICAGDVAKGKDTCEGDSGGPLQIRLKDPYCTYHQVGITSFGPRCPGNQPGVYTRVSHYIPWIESIVWP